MPARASSSRSRRRRASSLPGGPAYPRLPGDDHPLAGWQRERDGHARGDRAAKVDALTSPAPDLWQLQGIAHPQPRLAEREDELDRDAGQRLPDEGLDDVSGWPDRRRHPSGVPGVELEREQLICGELLVLKPIAVGCTHTGCVR
jgi:hypothetical protein